MDFFQAQENARRRTGLLVFLFGAAVVCIIGAVYLAAAAVTTMGTAGPEGPATFRWWQPEVFFVAAPATLAVIVCGSLFKAWTLRGGGGVVARSLGGVRVAPGTHDPAERRLLNVVEEMAIASGVRVPEVYLLPEDGINAFAAGTSADDAAIAVTRGALDALGRDELQGVVGHEFSHILAGDMRLNVRLLGLLFGIMLLVVIGRILVRSVRYLRSSGRNKNSGGAVVAIVLVGAGLILIGLVGVLFGRLVQAAVSRQREYLADAASVQFTRNPAGLAGALAKIASSSAGSRVLDAHATEACHLFFASPFSSAFSSLFATHPPIPARIRAIDPSFDPRRAAPSEAAPPPSARPPPPAAAPPPLAATRVVAALTALDAPRPAAGAAAINAIPEPLRDAAHDPESARALLVALLAQPTSDAAALARQEAVFSSALDGPARERLAALLPHVAAVPAHARLPLADLALPTLRATLAPADTERFVRALAGLAAADNDVSLFEFAVLHVVGRNLQPAAHPPARLGEQVLSFHALASEISTLLSAAARAAAPDPDAATRAFRAGTAALPLVAGKLAFAPAAGSGALVRALLRLDHASLPIKRAVLEALARAAAADGIVQPAELELLRAVAAALDLPAPPLAG
jgi:Zn-dependent protease with chaperone function